MKYSSSFSSIRRKGLRKGFTLMELIFVVITIALLVGLFFPSIIANKDKTQIHSVATNDAKLIASGITEWKGASSESDGTYANLDTGKLSAYLPSTMEYDGTWIHSTGLNGGIHYQVLSDKINSDGDSFKVYVDLSTIKDAQNFDDRMVTYAEKTLSDGFRAIAINKNTGTAANDATVETDAKGLGSANADFDTGGTAVDGLTGTRKIRF